MIKRIIIVFSLLSVFNINAQNRLLWDGELSTDTCQGEWGRMTDSIAYAGNQCFLGNPDPWHSPGIRLRCTPSWRANISGYDELRFRAKASVRNKTLAVSFYGWPNTSRGIEISPYIIGGGGLDTVWKEVRIPLDSFKTNSYQLGTIEIIYFGKSQPPSGYQIFVDEIWAYDIKPTRVTNTKIISNKVLRLDIADRYDTTAVKTLSNYALSSADDPDFATPQYPTKIGIHYYVEDYDPSDNYNNPIPIISYQLFPIFETPMKNGKTYTLTVASVRDMAGNDFAQPFVQTFSYNDQNEITYTVKANHIGYLPNRPKYGYIGNFLGGVEGNVQPLPINTAPTFEIRNAQTHAAVFSGTAVRRVSINTSSCGAIPDSSQDLRWSGEIVYSCDFSALTQAGEYYLYAAGYGRSYPFKISDTVYNETYKTVMRALYLNRCGTDLPPQYAGQWARPTCHAADGVIHTSHTASPLYNGETIGATVSSTRGWHDAGDYGKYIPSVTQAINDLLTAYELYPQKFPDNFHNIPESGNGVPDMLDEVKWEIDWLLTMQAPDGGAYFKVVTTDWPNNMPHLDLPTRWITEKTTHTTAQLTALLAAASRALRPYFPIYADTCLARARRGWAWLKAHPNCYPTTGFQNPTGIGGGEYSDPGETSDIDDRAWAAAELYKTTGEAAMHTDFLTYYIQNQPTFGWNNFQHHQLKATWAYCTTTFPTEVSYINSYKNSRRIGIENYELPRLNQTTYRCSHRPEVIPWIAWGAWGISSTYSWSQIKASYLLNRDFFDAAAINLDVQLGNNPQNRTYITGVGHDYPRDPLHHPSMSDNIAEPMPGLCVFGPHANLGGVGYYGATQSTKNLYPYGHWDCAPYPSLRRFYDVAENVAMSEPTREKEAQTAAVLAYFSNIPAVVLPLELLAFKGAFDKNSKVIKLNWQTLNEQNVAAFDIEHAFESDNFEKIGTQTAKNIEKAHYDFILQNPKTGIHRFRLKIKDANGKWNFSKIIEIIVLDQKTVSIRAVYPNPTTDYFTVSIDVSEKQNVQFDLFDAFGKCVNIYGVTHFETGRHEKTFYTEGGASGVYFLKIQTADMLKTVKIIKK